MDTTHTFPLPEAESGKLSAVTEELNHQPAYIKLKDRVRASPWPFVLISLAVGLVLGKVARSM